MTPLKITFVIEMSDAILERGAVLSAALSAAEAFKQTMSEAKHATTYTTEEAAPEKTRKPRTRHPVADAVEAEQPGDAPDKVAELRGRHPHAAE